MRLKTVRLFCYRLNWRDHETKFDEKLDVSGLCANVVRPAGVTEQSKLPVVVVSTCAGDALLVSELFFQVGLWWWFHSR